jgi:CDP-diglyceride synthetase
VLAPDQLFHYSSPREAVKVDTLVMIIGTLTGLAFVAPELEPRVTVVTGVAMQITYAIICRIFAAQRGRAPRPWLVAGFLTGVLAVLALLVLGDRDDVTA